MAATLPKLPAFTPSYSGLDWSGATVINVAPTDTIASKLATAVTTLQALGPGGRVDVLLQAGGSWTESVTLPVHGVKGGRIRIMTAGWSLAFPTRVTPTLAAAQNIATWQAPDGNSAVYPAPGARGYHIRGIKFTCSTTQAFAAFIAYTPQVGVNTVADIPWSMSLLQCWIAGNAAGQTRRNGIAATAAMLDIGYCYCAHFNYGGEDYSDQGQSISCPSGYGRVNIHDNYLYRAGEAIAFGGSSQFPALESELLVPSHITIKNNHIFTPLSVKGTELCANAIEFKAGRYILIEGNWIVNVWKDGQSGYSFVIWSANQGTESFVHTCDVTIRYNVSIATNCGVSLGNVADAHPSISPRRSHVHDNIFIAMGHTVTQAPDLTTVAEFLTPEPQHGDITFENNLCIGPGSNFMVLGEATPPYLRFWFNNNVIGNTGCTILDCSGGNGDTAWALWNANADCSFAGNVCIGGGVPSGNTVVADVASIGFADASKVNDPNFTYADLDALVISGANAGKGPDITALKAALPASVLTAAADLPT